MPYEVSNKDHYKTPDYATLSLLRYEKFDGSILEPACGDGAISKILEMQGYDCVSCDIREDNIYGVGGVDIFDLDGIIADNVITNPPYKYAMEFVLRSLEICNRKVAMLLRLSFLESARRYGFFMEFPLSIVYVFSKRISLYQGDNDNQGGGTAAYAWFVWDKSLEKDILPSIEWIDPKWYYHYNIRREK